MKSKKKYVYDCVDCGAPVTEEEQTIMQSGDEDDLICSKCFLKREEAQTNNQQTKERKWKTSKQQNTNTSALSKTY